MTIDIHTELKILLKSLNRKFNVNKIDTIIKKKNMNYTLIRSEDQYTKNIILMKIVLPVLEYTYMNRLCGQNSNTNM